MTFLHLLRLIGPDQYPIGPHNEVATFSRACERGLSSLGSKKKLTTVIRAELHVSKPSSVVILSQPLNLPSQQVKSKANQQMA